jgi:hypothetical protein
MPSCGCGDEGCCINLTHSRGAHPDKELTPSPRCRPAGMVVQVARGVLWVRREGSSGGAVSEVCEKERRK